MFRRRPRAVYGIYDLDDFLAGIEVPHEALRDPSAGPQTTVDPCDAPDRASGPPPPALFDAWPPARGGSRSAGRRARRLLVPLGIAVIAFLVSSSALRLLAQRRDGGVLISPRTLPAPPPPSLSPEAGAPPATA